MDDNEEIVSNCIFCKIRDGDIHTEFTYQDEAVMVFPDIKPMKSIHLLIIPKKHIKEFSELPDMALLAHIGNVVKQMITKFQLGDKGYRIVINGGGHQLVDHLHIHLMGPMGKAG
jgi:histidine triad (HIT) family protein